VLVIDDHLLHRLHSLDEDLLDLVEAFIDTLSPIATDQVHLQET
jgi:hypothetical protein